MTKGDVFISPRSDRGLNTLDQSIAGATAKVATKLLLYPFDTWKSRMQARRFGVMDDFKGLWTVAGMYRGVLPKLLLYTPYQALYMAVYVRARDSLTESRLGGSVLAFGSAGVIAEAASAVLRLPMEVAKVRLQLGVYSSSWHALLDFRQRPAGFYGCFTSQTLLHDCSYSACAWIVFETGRQKMFAWNGRDSLAVHENLVLGMCTGLVSAVATTPLDVVKTRIVGRDPREAQEAIFTVVRSIWREEGPTAFFRGAPLRVLHLAPSHGIYMLLYEAVKCQLSSWK